MGRTDAALAEAKPGSSASSVAELPAPASVWAAELETFRQSYLQILDRSSRRLITVVELLSPANKRPGRDRDQDLVK